MVRCEGGKEGSARVHVVCINGDVGNGITLETRERRDTLEVAEEQFRTYQRVERAEGVLEA
jgi:hypothetical protein